MDMNEITPLSSLRATLNRYVSGIAVAAVLGAGLIPNAHAQDNPVPAFWGGISVKITETYGNNNTKPLTGVKVILDLKYPEKAAAVLQKYPVITFPMVKTAGTRGANFTRIPPTKDVGDYIITIIPKPNDVNNEYACTPYPGKRGYTIGDKGEITEDFRMGTGGTNRRNYGYKCPKADTVNEFNRRKQGGYDLTIKIDQNFGTRGNGLWVALYNKDNKRLKWIRTGGNRQAKFRAVDPTQSPYRIAVHKVKNDNKPLYETPYDMPTKNVTYTAKIEKNSNQQQGGNKQSSNNQSEECHEVRVQAQGSSSRYGYLKTQSCKQNNGYWKIEPYKYNR